MIASVTDLDGRITGVHRTWLSPEGSGKAPIDTPRRAMGDLLGHAVRFDTAAEVLVAGEGIETGRHAASLSAGVPGVLSSARIVDRLIADDVTSSAKRRTLRT